MPGGNHNNGKGRSMNVHEDELPPMIDAQYSAWFALSFVPGGVGCRMGPTVGPDGELAGKLGRSVAAVTINSAALGLINADNNGRDTSFLKGPILLTPTR